MLLVVFSDSGDGINDYGSTSLCVVDNTHPRPQSWTCDGHEVAQVHLGPIDLREHAIDIPHLGDGMYENNACMVWRITTDPHKVRKSHFHQLQ